MKKTNEQLESEAMSFVDHLTELRRRLLYSLYAIIVTSIFSYNYSAEIFDIIRQPIAPYLHGQGFVFTAPMDKFVAHIKITLLSGVILACPFWVYQIWKFVAPGLYTKEKRYTAGFIVTGSLLFFLGVAFAFYVVYPVAFEFLLTYGGSEDTPMITINEYLSFFITTTLLFGVSFEMPLILVILGMLGVVDAKFLSGKRRYAIVVIAFISALLTPPDVISMVSMMIPLLILYEVAIVAVRFLGKKKELST